jgi:hypothetical protein
LLEVRQPTKLVAAAVPTGTHVHGSMHVHMSVREEKIRYRYKF